MSLYSAILRPLLFRLDAEHAHEFTLKVLSITPPAMLRLAFPIKVHGAGRVVFGLRFRNPLGLAAGMDKNAICLPAWEALGFGFVEIGTVTALAQPGNPKPRAFRYPSQRALINRMGFNNQGAHVIARRLARLKASGRWPRIPVGINLGKSKVTPLSEASDDYRTSMKALVEFGDYFVINVSSPNTPGLRELQESRALEEIARAVRTESRDKPVLVKIAPDLPDAEASALAEMAGRVGLAGLIATNTTLDHTSIPVERDQAGGLSGAPLAGRSTALLRILAATTSLPLVASGGIMDISSAREKIAAGAHLLQIYTGFVYRGPGLIAEVVGGMNEIDRDRTGATAHR